MKTIRHKFNLYWRNKRIIAPRLFTLNDYDYVVHIVDSFCIEVMVYVICDTYEDGYRCALYGFYKCYNNTKGIYFNFKGKRIYIGE